MKVLIVHPGPHFSVADVHNGLVKGLRANGCEVGVLNLDDRIDFYTQSEIKQEDGTYRKATTDQLAMEMASQGIEVACYEWWPDVVIIVSGFFIPPKLWGVLARRPHRVVYWCTESPYEDDRQGRAGRYADVVVLNDPTNLDQFRYEINPNTHYFPHSYDPDLHKPGPVVPDFASDFAFVGTGFPSRIDWLERVDWTGINVKLAGHWRGLEDGSPLLPFLMHDRMQCLGNDITADVYRSTKASMNLYRKEHSEDAHANGWAMGPREIELAACGTFFFREPRGEGDLLFPHLPTLGSPEEFGDQLRWWLAHDDMRRDAALKAQAAVQDLTFTNSAARLLRIIEAAEHKIVA